MSENSSELQRHIDLLEERLEKVSSASLKINSSLELDRVLREVVENARLLTKSRYGVITTVDANGLVEDVVTSGFTENENDRLLAWSEGPNLLEHLQDLPAPLLVADFPAYVHSLGFSTELIPVQTFLSMPLFHRETRVGNFFLAGKDGDQEFTSGDRDLLRSFALQAATAITNARTHHKERRVRADFDTLIQSSPFGVVIFNGGSGELNSYNSEARRIVEELGTPGRDIEELLDVVTCRRADGREVSLTDSPMARQLTDPETVYAEKITLSVPDGRNVSLLCNATPIRAVDGSVESLVVILQDLSPIEELTRLRGEMLSKITGALRAPLVAIKGSSASALSTKPHLAPNVTTQYFRIIDKQADRTLELIDDLLDYGKIVTGTLELDQIVIDVATLIEESCASFQNETVNRSVRIALPEDLPLVLADPTRIAQVASTLLSIMTRYADPTVSIDITAAREEIHVAVHLSTTNGGIPESELSHLFHPHNLPVIDEIVVGSSDGEIDLGICRGLVEANGGRIRVEADSASDRARITFTLPIAHDALAGNFHAPNTRYLPSSVNEPSSEAQILVINANLYTQRFVQESLSEAGYETRFAEFDDQLSDIFEDLKPDLVLLDLQQYGYRVQDKIAQISSMSDVPVIFIAPYGIDDVVVKALDAGAKDYVVTPFIPSELVARVRGALRLQTPPVPFTLGALKVDYQQRRVNVDTEQIELTAIEFELLRALSINAGRKMTYEMLLRQVWRKKTHTPGDTKAVRAVVKRLRQKLGDSATAPLYIHNERGVGYFIPRPNDPR